MTLVAVRTPSTSRITDAGEARRAHQRQDVARLGPPGLRAEQGGDRARRQVAHLVEVDDDVSAAPIVHHAAPHGPPWDPSPVPGVPLVVVGASAGGIEALLDVVAGLPSDLGAAVLVTVHTAARPETALPRASFLFPDESAATRMTCPECNGARSRIDLPHVSYFRCHVGHQYGPRSLEAAQREAAEAALWAAVAALEEHATLGPPPRGGRPTPPIRTSSRTPTRAPTAGRTTGPAPTAPRASPATCASA